MNSQYSIWLLPDAAHEPGLTRTVAELSAVQGESAFMPHVTIQGDLNRPVETLTELLDRLAQEPQPAASRRAPATRMRHALTLAARACARHTGTGTGLPRGVAG